MEPTRGDLGVDCCAPRWTCAQPGRLEQKAQCERVTAAQEKSPALDLPEVTLKSPIDRCGPSKSFSERLAFLEEHLLSFSHHHAELILALREDVWPSPRHNSTMRLSQRNFPLLSGDSHRAPLRNSQSGVSGDSSQVYLLEDMANNCAASSRLASPDESAQTGGVGQSGLREEEISSMVVDAVDALRATGAPPTAVASDGNDSEMVSAKTGTGERMDQEGVLDLGITSRVTAVVEEAPQQAFVVNVERLVETMETLELLHEVVKSTAIAALTFVGGSSARELLSTILFLFATFVVFVDHIDQHDRMDINDIGILSRLLPPEPATNCNELLKSMTVNTSQCNRARRFLYHFVVVTFITRNWLQLYFFRNPDCFDNTFRSMFVLETGHGLEWKAAMQLLGTQNLVLSVMYLLCSTYILKTRYETQCVMPTGLDGKAWDVRQSGIPLRFSVLGLPSMWFTSEQCKQRLLKWVDGVTPGVSVTSVYPEELGLLVLSDSDDARRRLANTFKQSMLIEAESGMVYPEKKLDMEICLFTACSAHRNMPFPGQFLEIGVGDDGRTTRTRQKASGAQTRWSTPEVDDAMLPTRSRMRSFLLKVVAFGKVRRP